MNNYLPLPLIKEMFVMILDTLFETSLSKDCHCFAMPSHAAMDIQHEY